MEPLKLGKGKPLTPELCELHYQAEKEQEAFDRFLNDMTEENQRAWLEADEKRKEMQRLVDLIEVAVRDGDYALAERRSRRLLEMQNGG